MATVTIELGGMLPGKKRKAFMLVAHGRTRKRVFTSVVLEAGEYRLPRRGGGVVVLDEAKELVLRRMVKDFETGMLDLGSRLLRPGLTAADIFEAVMGGGGGGERYEFFGFAERWLREAGRRGERNYRTFLNSLARFLGRRELLFTEVTYDLLRRYSDSLRDVPRARTMYLAAFRHLYTEGRLRYSRVGHEPISRLPFEQFRVPRQQPRGGRALSLDVLRRVLSFRARSRTGQLAVDCFMLSFCLMGMNSADLYEVRRLEGGVLKYNRAKTRERRADGAYIEVRVPPVVAELLRKYAGRVRVFNFYQRYASAQGFNRALNIGLREVREGVNAALRAEGRASEVLERLQFYQARHSWATVARNDCRVDKGTVAEALNHVDGLRVTDLYIRRDFAAINEANARVLDFVFGGDGLNVGSCISVRGSSAG